MQTRCIVMTAVLFGISAVGGAAADEYAPTTLSAVQVLAKAHAAYGQLQAGQYFIAERDVTPSEVETEMTQRNGDDFITIDTLNGHTSEYGVYQGQRWERDANGIVIRDSGFHGKEDPNALAWAHPDDPQYHVRVLGLTETAPQEIVVEANPPGGQDEYHYYNAQTFLLEKDVVFGVDRYRHETDYTQYHTLFGETIAFHVHYTDGRPANDEDDDIISFTASPSHMSLAIPEPQPIFGFLNAPVTVPATFSDDGITIPVQIAGHTFNFALDTGASGLFIDAGAASRAGLVEQGKSQGTIGGTFTMSEATVPQLSVGSLTAHNLVFTVGPMNGLDISGLLGCDFLASAVVGIDFKKQTVTLYPWATFSPAALGLHALPIQLDDCVPRAPASIENVPGRFLLDTGGFGTIVYRHYLSKLPRATVASEGETPDAEAFGTHWTFNAVGGQVHSTLYDISNLVFGGLGYRSGQVLVPDNTSTFQDPDYDGIFGRNLLKEYVFYLDYNDSVIFIKPNV